MDRLWHAPVLEFRMASHVPQVCNLLATLDVAIVGGERLLRLLRISFLGKKVMFERVIDGVPRKEFRGAWKNRHFDQNQCVGTLVTRDDLHFGDARLELA